VKRLFHADAGYDERYETRITGGIQAWLPEYLLAGDFNA
jgi:hypothetical protein